MTDDFSIELVPFIPSDEIVSCARHMVKLAYSLPEKDINSVLVAFALALTQVIGNMDFPTLQARDLVPGVLAEQIRRNLALVDENDRNIGGHGD